MISPCLRLNTEIVDTYHIQQRILFLQIASEASEEMPGTNMLILQTTVASLIMMIWSKPLLGVQVCFSFSKKIYILVQTFAARSSPSLRSTSLVRLKSSFYYKFLLRLNIEEFQEFEIEFSLNFCPNESFGL